jgi:uncharacterized protein
VEQLSGRLSELRDLLVGAETEMSDRSREQLKAETDVDQVRQRAERDQQRLDTGRVGSPKELENLQHEITTLGKRQGDLEDVVLEIMERAEAARAQAEQLTGERDAVTTNLTEAQRQRDEVFVDIDAAIAAASADRADITGRIDPVLLALYEKIRASQDGVGAAGLRQRRCEGCRLEITAAEMSRIRVAAPEEVIRCEECRRILVRLPDSGL